MAKYNQLFVIASWIYVLSIKFLAMPISGLLSQIGKLDHILCDDSGVSVWEQGGHAVSQFTCEHVSRVGAKMQEQTGR